MVIQLFPDFKYLKILSKALKALDTDSTAN